MDAKELRIFLGKVMTTLNDEIDNIADDDLIDALEQLVLNIEDAHNYIRLNFEMEASKKQLIKELREYLDKAEKDETTYCELLMEIPQLLKDFNCD